MGRQCVKAPDIPARLNGLASLRHGEAPIAIHIEPPKESDRSDSSMVITPSPFSPAAVNTCRRTPPTGRRSSQARHSATIPSPKTPALQPSSCVPLACRSTESQACWVDIT